MQRRTDLAVEAHEIWRESAAENAAHPGVRAAERQREGFAVTEVEILDETGAQALGKPAGRYVTLELDGLLRRQEGAFSRAVRAVGGEVEALLPAEGDVLVVGLGNRAVTPDLVGPLAAEHILVTRHLRPALPEYFGALRSVAVVTPGVLAATGVESGDQVSALVRQVRPACVVVIDALAARSVERLCRTVQLTDTGLVPGSGVGNHRMELSGKSLGVPVVAIGAPTVVDGATLVMDLLAAAGGAVPGEEALGGRELFVTPREVDSRVADLARVIGCGVSLGLNPSLTVEELLVLLE